MTGLQGDVWTYIGDSQSVQHLRQYFGSGRYSGAHFNDFAGGGSRPTTHNDITGDDIVAVGMLSVRIPWRTCVELVDGGHGWSKHLKKLPVDRDLWDDETDRLQLTVAGGPADSLWRQLRSIKGIDWVTAHKLVARKRPRLLPVYDKVVKAALQPSSNAFWEPLRTTLRSDARIVTRLEELRRAAGLSPRIPLLRVLDVAVWMRNWGSQSHANPKT